MVGYQALTRRSDLASGRECRLSRMSPLVFRGRGSNSRVSLKAGFGGILRNDGHQRRTNPLNVTGIIKIG